MSKVDKLFKEKLREHSLQPRALAWEKIESNLSKKSRGIIWFRVAATIALLGLLTVALINWKDSTQETPALVETKEIKLKETVPQAIEEPKESLVAAPSPTGQVKKQSALIQKSKEVTPTMAKETAIPELREQEEPLLAENQEPVVKPIQETEQKVVKEKSIVLVYSLPPPEAPKANEVTVAGTDSEDKKTGVQKILEAAKDVKNSDNAWGELRDVKNELFALDFKKDKNRKQ